MATTVYRIDVVREERQAEWLEREIAMVKGTMGGGFDDGKLLLNLEDELERTRTRVLCGRVTDAREALETAVADWQRGLVTAREMATAALRYADACAALQPVVGQA
jgi:hypothetical protein